MNRGERRALRHYRMRGYRLLESNARVGPYELDLVLRRGRRILVAEVKEKSGTDFGHPLEMVDETKLRRVHSAAQGWLAAHTEHARSELVVEAVGVRGRKVERVPLT